jgi:hypothetical protein
MTPQEVQCAQPSLIPQGERYHADLPDTLDLADRAESALNVLGGALDPAFNYEQYFHIYLGANPPFMMHDTTGRPTNDPKFLESFPYMRVMTGSSTNLDQEAGLMNGVVDDIGDDGLFYARQRPGRTWHEAAGGVHVFKDGDTVRVFQEDFANPYGNARLLIAMWAWYQRDANPLWLQRMKNIGQGLIKIAINKEDYAYYPESRMGEAFSYPASGWKNTDEPAEQDAEGDVGDSNIFMYHCGPIRAMSLLYQATGEKQFIDFARQLVNFVMKPKFWGIKDEPLALNGQENAHWTSHFPGHMDTFRALLDFAVVTNDLRIKDFVRRGYEYTRNYLPMGIGYIPWVIRVRCGCSQPRLLGLAIQLCDAGLGDYWDDIDRYVRNHAVETQALDDHWLRQNAENAPAHHVHAPQETDDHTIDRALGGFMAMGDPTVSSKVVKTGGCCNSNCSQGLYFAWESIVRFANHSATINLLLNRASPWLDIESHLPYQGKVVIRNKQARRAFVRIPLWVNRQQLRITVNGENRAAIWIDARLFIDSLNPHDTIEITFPVEERVEKHTVMERCEGVETHGGKERTIYTVAPTTYTCTFRGNTLVDITPRSREGGYPLYRRDHMRQDKAPTKSATRYATSHIIRWHA